MATHMKKRITKIVRRLLDIDENFATTRTSFSQDSEDEILEKIFWGKNEGFFVDIGAHHPVDYSNTYKFYLKGWRGINIDPRPNIMLEFDKIRPGDINLEIAIGGEKGQKDYYVFDPPGVNTFIKEIAFGRNLENGFKYVETRRVKTDTLTSMFDKYVGSRRIDFLNIDVECYEMKILSQNDWDKYRPNVIICEMLFSNISDNPSPVKSCSGSEFWTLIENMPCFDAHNLLVEKRYGILAKGVGSVIYVNKEGIWE
jgi:FkbM family methyltransferase